MYDIEIAIPVCMTQKKYVTRFKDFKKHGLVNVGDKKVLVKLLCGPGASADWMKEEWSQPITVETLEYQNDHAAFKIYHYYYDLRPEDLDNCRWFARIDDDTVTDVSETIRLLDERHGDDRESYVCGKISYDFHNVEKDLMTTLGHGSWYIHIPAEGLLQSPGHEFQMSILSHTAMKKILSEPKSRELIKLRRQIPAGWGDHCFALAAKLAKVHLVEAGFLSCEWVPHIARMRQFNGHLTHVHFVARDLEKSNEYFAFMDNVDMSKSFSDENINYMASFPPNESKLIRFKNNHIVGCHENAVFGIWGVGHNDKLNILLAPASNSRHELNVFKKENEEYFVSERKPEFTLTKIK